MNNMTDIQTVLFLTRFLFYRSSILSEVSTRSSSKLPSGKNILVFGEYLLCLIFLLGCIFFFIVVNPEASADKTSEVLRAESLHL